MLQLKGLALTAEQKNILNTCPPPSRDGATRKGQLTRITAAAGAGKTTTLLALALRAIELGHDQITYLTFTNAAAQDGERRLREALQQQQMDRPIVLEARTLHSCAKKQLTSQQQRQQDAAKAPPQWDDKRLKSWISNQCQEEIEEFLIPVRQELGQRKKDHLLQRAREQVEFFIYKSLVHFCQSSWTLQEYQTEEQHNPLTGCKRKLFGRDYYPMVKFHAESGDGKNLGFVYSYYANQKTFYAKQAARLFELAVRQDSRCFDFEMKRAQLGKLRIPGAILLVDESQDMDACQIEWVAAQQVHFGTHVYVVGDSAQSIYGFRGAKPRYLMDLNVDQDCKLTESWRFGEQLSNVANLILFAKENSPQTDVSPNGNYKNWIPYRTRPGEPKEGRVTEDSLVNEWKKHPVTFLARTNAELLLVALNALGFAFEKDNDGDEEENESGEAYAKRSASGPSLLPSSLDPSEMPKIHINGKGEQSGMGLWRSTLKLVEAVYQIYVSEGGIHLPIDRFPEFAGQTLDWSSFCQACESRELSRYSNTIIVVGKLKKNTLPSMEAFRTHVMEAKYSAENADIILSTCHSAKGMEWDCVQVCDDFINLNKFKKIKSSTANHSPEDEVWQFHFENWGDDVNLAYVACTRAKTLLSLPQCITKVLKTFDEIHSFCIAQQGKTLESEHEKEKMQRHKDLVLPLRRELRIEGKTMICDKLIQNVLSPVVTAVETLDNQHSCNNNNEMLEADAGTDNNANDAKLRSKKARLEPMAAASAISSGKPAGGDGSNTERAIELLD